MNYRSELRKMNLHRKAYCPVLLELLGMHTNPPESGFPVDLIDRDDAALILELMDIGYLDERAFVIRKRFGTVERCLYSGHYPLTKSGYLLLKEWRRNSTGRRIADLVRKLLGKPS